MSATIDPWTFFKPEEFRERQDRARKAAQDAGLDGLVIYSRGGGPVDMHADVLYLTNHYSQQPYVADHVGVGSARSHGVVLLPVEGPTVLIVDIPHWRKDIVVADDVRASIYITERVGEALKDTGLMGKRVGLCGTSYMSGAAYAGLYRAANDTQLVHADEIIEQLRIQKSARELEFIRHVVHIGNMAVESMMDAAVEGATEAGCVQAAYDQLVPSGAKLYDAACSSGPNAHLFSWGRLPSHDATRPMEIGDFFHVDCYGAFGGYLWDFGRTRIVGDNPSKQQRDLIEATIDCVETICNAIKPGMTGDDVLQVGMQWLDESEVVASIPEEEPETEGFPAVGHGLGMSWEGPWLMEGEQAIIEPGMYLAVEMMLGHKSMGGTFFEHNGLVTETGFEILTTCRKRWWS